MLKIVFILLSIISLNAYELPTLELKPKGKLEIVLFNAKSVLVEEKLSYLVKWKTVNATDVNITYIGKVELAGEIVVTEDEYNRGPITLIASNRVSKDIVKAIINKKVEGLEDPMIFKNEISDEEGEYYYNTRPRMRSRPLPRMRRYY